MDDIEVKFTWDERLFSFFMRIDQDEVADRDLLEQFKAFNMCEPELSFLMFRALRKDDVFVDGGACTGIFTLFARTIGAQVVAYEPARENMVRLRDNLAVNNFTSGITLCTEALWSSNQKLKFVHDVHAGQHSLGTTDNPRWSELVTTTTLNELPTTPRVIKLDIEGAEEHALRGATYHLVDQACPYVVTEMNLVALKRMGSSQNSLRSVMYAHGYDTFLLHKDGSYPALLPRSVTIAPTWNNCNILFSTPEKVLEIWPVTPIV